jgi:hypothetical protein
MPFFRDTREHLSDVPGVSLWFFVAERDLADIRREPPRMHETLIKRHLRRHPRHKAGKMLFGIFPHRPFIADVL